MLCTILGVKFDWQFKKDKGPALNERCSFMVNNVSFKELRIAYPISKYTGVTWN
jgi:hypothetical protein